MPIIIGNNHVGNFFTGQFLTEKPDIEFFRNQARKYDFNETDYLSSLEKVPIFNENQIKANISFLVQLTEIIGNIGIRNLHNLELTKQLKLEKEILAESQRRFTDLMLNVKLLSVMLDTNGNIIFCNNYFSSLTQYSTDEIKGKNWFDIFLPKQIVEHVKLVFQEMMNGNEFAYNYENEIITKDGKTLIVSWNNTALYDEKKQIIGTASIVENITDRKLAENKLKESEEKYRSIFDNVQDVFYRADLTGVLLEISPSIKYFSEFSKDEILGTSVYDLYYDPTDRLILLNAIKEKGELLDFELKLKTKTGKIKYASINARLISDSNGKPSYIDGTIRDITERKQAEKQLKLLSRAVEQSPVIVVITNKAGNIEYVNPKFAEVTGYTLDEAMGKNPNILQSGEHTKEFYEKLWETILSGKDWHGEFHNKKKNGDLYWENAVISSIVNIEDNISFFVAVKEDITENKKMVEELIKSKEKAEESDRLKTVFLHNISHEIRTPMNAIIGFSGFLNDPALIPEKRNHFTDIIIQSSDQLLLIIDDIIKVATIEAGQEKVHETEIELNSKLRLLLEQFSIKAKKQNISLNLKSYISDKEIFIFTDEKKLIQVLTNLIGNAIKFTKQGYVNFGYEVKNNELAFFVEDSGIGIPAEMHEEIFKRFRQVETTTVRNYGGSGLGLSISKAYIELLGGRMWLHSEIDKGSTFYFTIPFKKAVTNKLSEKQSYKVPEIENKTVKTLLIAEDEDSNFMLIEELLSDLNLKLIRAVNGLEAVNICKSNERIDLILMDIKMPVMDGYEATKQIKKFMPNLPIIAQTAYTADADKSKALAFGCTDFISKPLKQSLLISKINKQLYWDKK